MNNLEIVNLLKTIPSNNGLVELKSLEDIIEQIMPTQYLNTGDKVWFFVLNRFDEYSVFYLEEIEEAYIANVWYENEYVYEISSNIRFTLLDTDGVFNLHRKLKGRYGIPYEEVIYLMSNNYDKLYERYKKEFLIIIKDKKITQKHYIELSENIAEEIKKSEEQYGKL